MDVSLTRQVHFQFVSVFFQRCVFFIVTLLELQLASEEGVGAGDRQQGV